MISKFQSLLRRPRAGGTQPKSGPSAPPAGKQDRKKLSLSSLPMWLWSFLPIEKAARRDGKAATEPAPRAAQAKPPARPASTPPAAARPAPAVSPARAARRPAARNDDPDAEMFGDGPAAQARQRERDRCGAIFASPEAEGRFDSARAVAFETSMPAERAIELLATLPRSDRSAASARRAARNPRIGPGGGFDVPREAAVAVRWDRAFQAAHGLVDGAGAARAPAGQRQREN